MSRVTRTGLIFAFLGIFILTGRALLHNFELTASLLGATLLDLLRDIGIGFIVLGLFNLILARSDWQEYFEERLRGVVTDYEFLEHLDPAALRELVRAAIKAQSTGAAVDREGGFLQFFETHLHKFIFDPYRENATAEISYADDSDPSAFLVIDKFSYVARNVGGTLQDRIRFTLDPPECIGGGQVSIVIKLPEQASEPGKLINLLERSPLKEASGGGYEIDIALPKEYAALDRLEVSVEATYKAPRRRIQTWWILAPTRDLRLILSFPRVYEIHVKDFVQAPQLADWTRTPGYVMFHYPSWVLPGNGIVWEFSRADAETKPTEQVADCRQ